ncbi:MAG: radical SAM protein [bacterium]|nr:radical SAM protein [bacterium]
MLFKKKKNEPFAWMGRTETQDVSEEITRVYLELSTFCNLSCKTCLRNSISGFKPRHFSKALMKKTLDSLSRLPNLNRVVLLGFGEALCNPSIKELLSALRVVNADIVLVSNVALLTEDMARFLVDLPINEIFVSWDDETEENSVSIRTGADIALFKKNIGFLSGLSGSKMKIGVEVVASKRNYSYLKDIISLGDSLGAGRFIISNLFPFTEEMKDDILYSQFEKPEIDLKRLLKKELKKYSITLANQNGNRSRACPFIEKGTIFISSSGDAAPCPQLAYNHRAYYFGSVRAHNKLHFGSISKETLPTIWNKPEFITFRESFLYYDYPDCSACVNPHICSHRISDEVDCYGNATPCGECLWAKDIIVCP